MSCFVKGRDEPFINTECVAYNRIPPGKKSYGYKQMTIHSLKKADGIDDLYDFPDNSKIGCQVYYNDRTKITANESIMIRSKSFQYYSFNETTGNLEKDVLESGERDEAIMIVKKGMPNKMHVKVNEITQNTVHANGK